MQFRPQGRGMRRGSEWTVLGAALGLALAAAGCTGGATSSGSFERSLSVTGPARLELANGSGSVQISAGDPGQVRIRGEVRIRTWLWDSAERRLAEFTSHPPIEQRGNIIRVGYEREAMRRATVSYTISVPAETDVQA